jgi:hypothetical protein
MACMVGVLWCKLATQTDATTERVTKTIEKIRYFEMSGMAEALFGVIEETRPRKKVSARRTEMERVIFSPPMFG